MATAPKKTAASTEKKTAVKPAPKAASTKTAVKPAVKKTTTVKAATTEAKPKKAPAKKAVAIAVSPEHRYHMIATAAYYLAERRGFAGGYEMQDWITAEAEIDAQLK
jgi:hypothetical protein